MILLARLPEHVSRVDYRITAHSEGHSVPADKWVVLEPAGVDRGNLVELPIAWAGPAERLRVELRGIRLGPGKREIRFSDLVQWLSSDE